MNIVVHYVTQCGNDDIYVRSFILCLGTAFIRLVRVLFVLSLKVECVFLSSSYTAVNCLKSQDTAEPETFTCHPWFQARRLTANNKPREPVHRLTALLHLQQVLWALLWHFNYLLKVKIYWCATGIVIGLSCHGTGCGPGRKNVQSLKR